MHIQFTARHFQATPELQRFAEDCVAGLGQMYDGIISAEIVLEERPHGGDDQIAEVILGVYKETLVAKDQTDDILKSIQSCVDKLERQLSDHKKKVRNRKHPGA